MRTVLITGSSRGIGFAMAESFAARGDKVVLNCKEDIARLQKSVGELKTKYDANERITGIRADVSDYASCEKMFSQAEDIFGPVEVLINNAGESYFGLFSDMKPCEMEKIIATNLITAINASHIVIPKMVRAKAGCIINISSVWGISGASCEAVYSAAKAGVIGLTKSLAKELAPSNIRVNAIACGAFDTRMNSRLSEEEKNDFTESIPLGRFGVPKEAADSAVFLASENSNYMTGKVLILDGGLL